MSLENTAESTVSDSKSNFPTNTFYAQKRGMTRIFDAEGKSVPVTVLEILSGHIVQVKNQEKDKYSAYKVAYNQKRSSLIPAPVKGQLKKANVSENYSKFFEVRTEGDLSSDIIGQKLSLENFQEGKLVTVSAISKGKGFQGVMKRFNFSGGPAAHGSQFHRGPGSIGNRATPARVYKGKKLPGHMGSELCTVSNLRIVAVKEEQNYILVKGSVPGSKSAFVKVRLVAEKK